MFLTSVVRAIELLKNAISWRHAATAEASASVNFWTPETVEAAIDAAGRAEVFEEARRLGWTSG